MLVRRDRYVLPNNAERLHHDKAKSKDEEVRDMVLIRVFSVRLILSSLVILATISLPLGLSADEGNDDWRLLRVLNKEFHVGFINRDLISPWTIREAGIEICGEKDSCFVRFWSDADVAPVTENSPLTQASIDAVVGQYVRYRHLGMEDVMVNCKIKHYVGCLSTQLWRPDD